MYVATCAEVSDLIAADKLAAPVAVMHRHQGSIDPSGLNLVTPILVGDQGVARCEVNMKVRGQDAPVTFILDVDLNTLNNLTSYANYRAAQEA